MAPRLGSPLVTLLFAIGAIWASAPAEAGKCQVSTSQIGTPLDPGPHGEVGVALAGLYVFHDDAPLTVTIPSLHPTVLGRDVIGVDTPGLSARVNGVGTWVYQETNRIPGLQRDDHFVDDTCKGWVLPDAVIF